MGLDFQEIFALTGPSLYRLAYSYVKNASDAEDIVQETFLRLLHANKEFVDYGEEKRWLMTVTANQCKDLLRSAKWRREVSANGTEKSDTEPSGMDERIDVRKALFSLQEKYRIVIFLYYYEGYSSNDIAKILHISQSAVLSRLERARKQLQPLLGGEWLEG